MQPQNAESRRQNLPKGQHDHFRMITKPMRVFYSVLVGEFARRKRGLGSAVSTTPRDYSPPAGAES